MTCGRFSPTSNVRLVRRHGLSAIGSRSAAELLLVITSVKLGPLRRKFPITAASSVRLTEQTNCSAK
jgi:hypothetical protein